MTSAFLKLSFAGLLLSLVPNTLFAQLIGDKSKNAARIPNASDRPGVARKVMYDFASCVVFRSRHKVDVYLATYPGSKRAYAAGTYLSTDKCLDGDGVLKFNETLLRASIYSVLYGLEFPSAVSQNLTSVAPIDYSPPAGTASYGDPRAQVILRQFADCVVRAKLSEAHELMFTKVGSPAEARIFDSMTPGLAPCMIKDATVKFSRSLLRGIIAEVLYRLSKKISETAANSAGGI